MLRAFRKRTFHTGYRPLADINSHRKRSFVGTVANSGKSHRQRCSAKGGQALAQAPSKVAAIERSSRMFY